MLLTEGSVLNLVFNIGSQGVWPVLNQRALTLQVKLKLGTACTLGPTVLEDKGILAAECGVPLHFPFKVYDDNHKPALLEKSVSHHNRHDSAISDVVCSRGTSVFLVNYIIVRELRASHLS